MRMMQGLSEPARPFEQPGTERAVARSVGRVKRLNLVKGRLRGSNVTV